MEKRNKMIKELSVIVGLSVMAGLLINYFSPNGISYIGSWDTASGVITAKAKNDAVVREREIMDVKTVKQIFDAGKTVFIDARSYKEYEKGHIKGGISFPAAQFDERIEAFLLNYSPSISIVTYCSGRECRDSHELAQMLIDSGFSETRVFIDGYPLWEKEGYPIE
ncbi:MAG: rhodanese-like domain-containing protein [Deltaproteobacteria bacterium]|nr:rhodanese-like domain-containing protein [Deltaproteobacteria bacterium]